MDLPFEALSLYNQKQQQQEEEGKPNKVEEDEGIEQQHYTDKLVGKEEIIGYFKSTWSWVGSQTISSLVDSVKVKTENIINVYKEDLADFGNNMRGDIAGSSDLSLPTTTTTSSLSSSTTNTLESDGSSIKSKIKKSITSFIGEYPPSYDNQQPPSQQNINECMIDGTNSDQDDETLKLYLVDNQSTEYITFRNQFQLLQYKELIVNILTTDALVKKHYNSLVPMRVNEFDFWSRYLYYSHIRRNENKAKADIILSKNNEQDELDQIKWEEDEDNETTPAAETLVQNSDNQNTCKEVLSIVNNVDNNQNNHNLNSVDNIQNTLNNNNNQMIKKIPSTVIDTFSDWEDVPSDKRSDVDEGWQSWE